MWKLFIEQLLSVVETIEYDLLTVLLAMTLLVLCMLANQILGGTIAMTKCEFDIKRFLKSLLKGFLICLAIVILCTVLDVFPVLLQRINLIDKDSLIKTVITVVNVVAILVIAITKYCKDIYDKLLSLFNVKKEEVDEIVQTTFNSDKIVMQDSETNENEVG